MMRRLGDAWEDKIKTSCQRGKLIENLTAMTKMAIAEYLADLHLFDADLEAHHALGGALHWA